MQGESEQPAVARERLPWRTLLAFALPVSGIALPIMLIQLYFLKFATDVLLLSPSLVALLVGLGRVWDAVSDPATGYLSDRTDTRIGRRRPWMLAAIPLLVASVGMLWSPPESLSHAQLLAWSGVGLLLSYTAFTFYGVPHQSLGAELSLDHHERSRIFGMRHVAFQLGVIGAFVCMQLLETTASPRELAGDLARFSSALCALLLLIPPLLLRERPEFRGRGGRSSVTAFRDVFRNPHARVLLGVFTIEALGAGVLGVLAPYYADYVLESPRSVIVVPAAFFVAAVGSIPLWIRLSRRYGKHRVWRVAMVGTAFSFGGTIFVGAGDVVLTGVLMFSAGLWSGCGGAVGQSILADVIDVDELETGERKEGAYSATWSFAQKLGVAAVVMLTGVVLDASGFQPNVKQAPEALLALRLLFAVPPLLGFGIGALVFWRRFRLDEATHRAVRLELDTRAAAATGRPPVLRT